VSAYRMAGAHACRSIQPPDCLDSPSTRELETEPDLAVQGGVRLRELPT